MQWKTASLIESHGSGGQHASWYFWKILKRTDKEACCEQLKEMKSFLESDLNHRRTKARRVSSNSRIETDFARWDSTSALPESGAKCGRVLVFAMKDTIFSRRHGKTILFPFVPISNIAEVKQISSVRNGAFPFIFVIFNVTRKNATV